MAPPPSRAALLPSVQTLALSLLKTDTHRKAQELCGGVDGGEGVERKELEKALGKKNPHKMGKPFWKRTQGFLIL